MILEREIKDAKMSTFSSDFQTLIFFPLYFLNVLLMSLRSVNQKMLHVRSCCFALKTNFFLFSRCRRSRILSFGELKKNGRGRKSTTEEE